METTVFSELHGEHSAVFREERRIFLVVVSFGYRGYILCVQRIGHRKSSMVSVHEEDTAVVNTYMPNVSAPKSRKFINQMEEK